MSGFRPCCQRVAAEVMEGLSIVVRCVVLCVQASVLRMRRLSEAVSLARLSEVSSLYIPLAPPLQIPCVRCAQDDLAMSQCSLIQHSLLLDNRTCTGS